jgi:hypothetical protein
MELDFSQKWQILGPRLPDSEAEGPAAFALRELAAMLGRMGCLAEPFLGEGSGPRLIMLDSGHRSSPSPGGRRLPYRFSWRTASDRVEIFGDDPPSLLRAVYDFLEALGARWVEPGEGGERLPAGPLLTLEASSRSSADTSLPSTLILGHGVFLEDWKNRLLWAARSGYSSVFIHTTPDALALGAAPESLYESHRAGIAALAASLGLGLELGGHSLSSLLPRSLFKTEPGLFREKEGTRRPDQNLCPSSERALDLVSAAFAARAAAHPEIAVFHAWPADLPGGGWCSCPDCASLSPAAQSLKVAARLAAALAAARPEAALSFLAYHDTEDSIAAIEASSGPDGAPALPANLELLWAPRLRSWGSALGDPGNSLNASSLAAFRATAAAWHGAGGGRVAVFEYWEDAMLFKAAVPPLSSVIAGDLEAYRPVADAIGILCTGGRLPLGPRPNVYLLPRLAARPAGDPAAADLVADWARAAYGALAPRMIEYWAELEAAWAIDLDIQEGDTEVHFPASFSRSALDPPADWGDPWKAGLERLGVKRGRCDELFDHLRRAEALLADVAASLAEVSGEGQPPSREALAARGEAAEYAIAGALLELDCARLSAYHELAGGDPASAADIANIALSASRALRNTLAALPDRRSRHEIAFLITLFFDLRLRFIRRANARSALRRLLDLWFVGARTALAAARVARSYEAEVPETGGLALGTGKS